MVLTDPSYVTGEKISSDQWDTILKQATGPDTFRTLVMTVPNSRSYPVTLVASQHYSPTPVMLVQITFH